MARGEILDKRDIDQYKVKIGLGVNHTYRDVSIRARWERSLQREGKNQS